MTGSVIAGAVALLLLLIANRLHPTAYDNYVLLADAFRHGHVWIDWPGAYIDALSYVGRHYVIEGPLPAILLLPAVAIWGTAANQTVLASLLGGLATGTGWEIARRAGVAVNARMWLVAFLLLGTDLFWCSMYGDVWFIAHVAAAAFTLLALAELLGAKRAWLVALYAACAVESRFSMVLALPVYAAWLWFEATSVERTRKLVAFAAALVPFVVFYVWYNEARWGTPYDIGYTAWYHQDQVGQPTGSPFRLAYVQYELYSFFVQFPDVLNRFPWLVPTYNGVALTWTSPALLLAFFARAPRREVALLWIATLLVALPSVTYYVNGFAQFGMRHALDFEPFLFVLMVFAARAGFGVVWQALCAWSVLAGTWGVWYWKSFYRAL